MLELSRYIIPHHVVRVFRWQYSVCLVVNIISTTPPPPPLITSDIIAVLVWAERQWRGCSGARRRSTPDDLSATSTGCLPVDVSFPLSPPSFAADAVLPINYDIMRRRRRGSRNIEWTAGRGLRILLGTKKKTIIILLGTHNIDYKYKNYVPCVQ